MAKLIIVVLFLPIINLGTCEQTSEAKSHLKIVCFTPHGYHCNASDCNTTTQTFGMYDQLKVPDTLNVRLKCEEDEDVHLNLNYGIYHYVPFYKSYNDCVETEGSQAYCNPYRGCSTGICCEGCCEEVSEKSSREQPYVRYQTYYSGSDRRRGVQGERLVTLTRRSIYMDGSEFCQNTRCYTHFAALVYTCVKRHDDIGFSVGVSIAMFTVIATGAAAACLLVCRKKSASDDNLQSPANRDIPCAVSYSTNAADNNDVLT